MINKYKFDARDIIFLNYEKLFHSGVFYVAQIGVFI